MPIQDRVLQEPQNRFLKAKPISTPLETLPVLKSVGGKMWWYLVVQYEDKTWSAIKFGKLAGFAMKIGTDFFSTPWKQMPLPRTASVKQSKIGTRAAKDLAVKNPEKVVVVTNDDGKLTGIISIEFLNLFSDPSLWELYGVLADLSEDARVRYETKYPPPICPYCNHQDYFDYEGNGFVCRNCGKYTA